MPSADADADGQHRALELARLLALVKSDQCDVAVGSRFVSETATEPYRYRLSLFTPAGTALLRRGMGLVLRRPFADATSGLYAVNAKALPLLAEAFTTEAPEVEALIRIVDAWPSARGVPVDMSPRAGGERSPGRQGRRKVVLTVAGALVAAKFLQSRRSR